MTDNAQNSNQNVTQEKVIKAQSGWPMLFVSLFLLLGSAGLAISTAISNFEEQREAYGMTSEVWTGGAAEIAIFALCGLGLIAGFMVMGGLFSLKPNKAMVFTFVGNYKGTVKQTGYLWRNPLWSGDKISLRAFNHSTGIITVNDSTGTPIKIEAVVVARVVDTARATFDVDGGYKNYVEKQADAGLRDVAKAHPYDGKDDEITLQGDTEKVNAEMERQLAERFTMAGVGVIEARISHLEYAPQIAEQMLKRQQAKAILDAREIIVKGAVDIVGETLKQLEASSGKKFSEAAAERIAAGLLITICSDQGTSPVLPIEA